MLLLFMFTMKSFLPLILVLHVSSCSKLSKCHYQFHYILPVHLLTLHVLNPYYHHRHLPHDHHHPRHHPPHDHHQPVKKYKQQDCYRCGNSENGRFLLLI